MLDCLGVEELLVSRGIRSYIERIAIFCSDAGLLAILSKREEVKIVTATDWRYIDLHSGWVNKTAGCSSISVGVEGVLDRAMRL